jgi:flavin reductase (DIM6/NTAB) family NADH-FMN oxidoreductase RutF
MAEVPDSLREVMRTWPTGVAVVTSASGGVCRGLTVNSLASVSLDPPRVVFSIANESRTLEIIRASNAFAVTMLDEGQQHISDVFAGKIAQEEDRFTGLEIFSLVSGAPLLKAGRAFLDCRVVHAYSMPHSTLFVGEVLAATADSGKAPLVYLNRGYHQVAK